MLQGGIEAAALYRQHESHLLQRQFDAGVEAEAEAALRSEGSVGSVGKSIAGASSLDRSQVRVASTGGRLPIVAMSANSDAETRSSALDAGMDVFMGKPFVMDDLNEALTAFFV